MGNDDHGAGKNMFACSQQFPGRAYVCVCGSSKMGLCKKIFHSLSVEINVMRAFCHNHAPFCASLGLKTGCVMKGFYP